MIIEDENYNLIKKKDKINKKSLQNIYDIAVNEENRELYFLDSDNDRIIVTDFELNFIEYFGCYDDDDDDDDDDKNFDSSSGICFKNGFLYVSDKNNERVQIFDKDLEFINSLDLGYAPKQVCASNAFNHKTQEFYCFDSNGNLIEQIQLNENNTNSCFNGKLIVFNKNLLMSSYTGKKLIKFRLVLIKIVILMF